jgi:hypothetical protein
MQLFLAIEMGLMLLFVIKMTIRNIEHEFRLERVRSGDGDWPTGSSEFTAPSPRFTLLRNLADPSLTAAASGEGAF